MDKETRKFIEDIKTKRGAWNSPSYKAACEALDEIVKVLESPGNKKPYLDVFLAKVMDKKGTRTFVHLLSILDEADFRKALLFEDKNKETLLKYLADNALLFKEIVLDDHINRHFKTVEQAISVYNLHPNPGVKPLQLQHKAQGSSLIAIDDQTINQVQEVLAKYKLALSKRSAHSHFFFPHKEQQHYLDQFYLNLIKCRPEDRQKTVVEFLENKRYSNKTSDAFKPMLLAALTGKPVTAQNFQSVLNTYKTEPLQSDNKPAKTAP